MPDEPAEMTESDCHEWLSFWQNMPDVGLSDADTQKGCGPIEHKPYAEAECHVMVLVREGTVNTGNAAENELTADPTARI
jgi:hypothetical protein